MSTTAAAKGKSGKDAEDARATGRRHVASCSFCYKSNTEVGRLVAGHGIYICDECVDLCVQIIAGAPRGGPVAMNPFEQMSSVDEVLKDLPRAATTVAQTENYIATGVRRARELGATWARIGEAFGMTRQSAWERFSGEE
jgi:hypothetical protein